jgi:hypothetical protein
MKQLIHWDWKASPDLDDLKSALNPLGISVVEVDTGGDTIAFVLSDKRVTDEEAQKFFDSDGEEPVESKEETAKKWARGCTVKINIQKVDEHGVTFNIVGLEESHFYDWKTLTTTIDAREKALKKGAK